MFERYGFNLEEGFKLPPQLLLVLWDLHHKTLTEDTVVAAKSAPDELFFNSKTLQVVAGANLSCKILDIVVDLCFTVAQLEYPTVLVDLAKENK